MMTPEGAMTPKPTGIRHGPFGTHLVPTLPISQLAAGMQSAKPARNSRPSARRRSSMEYLRFIKRNEMARSGRRVSPASVWIGQFLRNC